MSWLCRFKKWQLNKEKPKDGDNPKALLTLVMTQDPGTERIQRAMIPMLHSHSIGIAMPRKAPAITMESELRIPVGH